MTARPELAINQAIRQIAEEEALTLGQVARLLYISEFAVWSWYRRKPFAAPMMALDLLCRKLKRPMHPLIKEAMERG